MPTRYELENMGMAELAEWCGKVAERPTASSVEADQAREFKGDWELLRAEGTPPIGPPKDQKYYEARIERLRLRMVELLCVALPASNGASKA
jgi:hypothetical protein